MELETSESRLQNFPVPLFAVVMGMSGLTIAFEKAHEFLNYPLMISRGLLVLTTFIFLFISGMYLLKIVKYWSAVKEEFAHPIRMNFFPAISICLLLFSIAFFHINKSVSGIFWYIGAPLHLVFTLHVLKTWFEKSFTMDHLNPAWFIPVVGNVLVPLTGVYFGGIEVSQFYFSVGIFFWPLFLAVIFNRMIFHGHLQKKFLPTMFIFIAPAAVGFVAYYKINMMIAKNTGVPFAFEKDFFAHFLYDIAIFFTILLFSMVRSLAKLQFSITWWAYTFPMTAVTIASMITYKISHKSYLAGHGVKMFKVIESYQFFYYLSQGLLTLACIIIAIVTFKTLIAASKREICVAE